MTFTQTTTGREGRMLRESQTIRPSFLRSNPTFAPYELSGEARLSGAVRTEAAFHRFLDRSVIIQQLVPSGTARAQQYSSFVQGVHVQATLRHPCLAQVFDAGVHNDQPYAIVERPRGATIDEQARHSGGMDLLEAVQIVSALADLMEKAHAAGIRLYNLAPDNIVVAADGTPVLLTIGTSESPEALCDDPVHLAFAAPELLSGAPTDQRSDIYALGALLYYTVTGRMIFHGSVDAILSQKQMSDPALGTLPPEGGAELEALIRRATARRAADRYESVTLMRRDLDLLIGQVEARATPLMERELGAPLVNPYQAMPIALPPRIEPLAPRMPAAPEPAAAPGADPLGIPGADREEFRGALPYSILVPYDAPAAAAAPASAAPAAKGAAAGLTWLMLILVIALAVGTAWMLG